MWGARWAWGRVERLLLRLSLVAAVFQLINGFTWSIYAPFLRGQGFTGTEYGLVGSTTVFSSIAGSLLAGWLSDRYGSRWVIASGAATLGVSNIVLSLGGFTIALLAGAIGGLGGGLLWVSMVTLVSRAVDDRVLDKAFSYTNAAATIAAAGGSYMGFLPRLLSETSGAELQGVYAASLRLAGLALIASSLLAMAVEERYTRRPQATPQAARPPWRVFAKLTLVELVIGLGAALSIHNIDYYFAKKYGVTSAELGAILGTEQLAMGLLMLAMPRLSRRVGGPLRAYIIVAAPSIPLIVAMTLVDDLLLASALFIARTVLMNVASPLYQAFQMSLLPPQYRGRGSAVLGLAWQVPVGVGRALGGHMMDIDLELPLRATAALYATAMAMLAAFFPDHVRGSRASPSSCQTRAQSGCRSPRAVGPGED